MLYLIQEAPLETTNYMIAGYAVTFAVMLIYLVSLILRRRNLMQEMQVLQELDEQASQKSSEHTPHR